VFSRALADDNVRDVGTARKKLTAGRLLLSYNATLRASYDEIVGGLRPGELVATDGAIFLSNMLAGGVS
jgi:hypothetical protein